MAMRPSKANQKAIKLTKNENYVFIQHQKLWKPSRPSKQSTWTWTTIRHTKKSR